MNKSTFHRPKACIMNATSAIVQRMIGTNQTSTGNQLRSEVFQRLERIAAKIEAKPAEIVMADCVTVIKTSVVFSTSLGGALSLRTISTERRPFS